MEAEKAPRFSIDHRKTAVPPIWIDDRLNVIKRGKVVGNMGDASLVYCNIKVLHIVMNDCRKISTKNPFFRRRSDDIENKKARPPGVIGRSFQWIAETAEEIVTCNLLHQRLEVVRRRNDEWRSNRAFEAEQIRLIHKMAQQRTKDNA